MTERTDKDLAAAIDMLLSIGGSRVELPDTDVPAVMVPEGYNIESLAHLVDEPRHKSGTTKLRDAESVGRHIVDHGDPATRLYADLGDLTGTVVLDDHKPGLDGQRRAAHRVVFAPEKHPDWTAWREADGRLIPQAKFAQFLEDHEHRITDPDAADLLEIVQDLEMTSSLAFRSSERLATGARAFMLAEAVTGRLAGRLSGQSIELPARIGLALPVFRHSEALPLQARLRYRLDEGKLQLGFRLILGAEAEEEAFRAELNRIVEISRVVVLW